MSATYHFRITQGESVVANGSCADERRLLREMWHYAALYAAGGAMLVERRKTGSKWRPVDL